MTSQVWTVLCGDSIPDLCGIQYASVENETNELSPCEAYQSALTRTTTDVVIYVHSDVTIHEGAWLDRVMGLFLYDDDTIAVGLGGASSLGNKDLYRKPYDIRNMARGHYMSNQTDAQVHGERFTGCRRVAVLDAFLMAIRTEWLRSIGDWPVGKLTHHCMDLWLACEAARHGKEIWMTGVSCTHHGGGTSTKAIYKDAKWLQAGSMESDHILPHLWLYNEYRDVLPIEV